MILPLQRLKAHFLINGVFTLLIFCLFSCKKDNEEIYNENKQDAKVKIINASQKTPNIDLFFNDAKLNDRSITFGEDIDYIKVSAGEKKPPFLMKVLHK